MKIQISRDVVFHEKHFPFHLSKPSSPIPFFIPASTPLSPFFIYDVPDIFSPPSNTSITPNSTSSSQSSQPSPPLNSHPTPLPSSPSSSSLTRSTRPTKIPSHLHDFQFTLPTTKTASLSQHWCNLVQFDSLSSSHRSLVSSISQYTGPQSYKAASTDQNWLDAMSKELQALNTNNTWDVVPLPQGKNPLGVNGSTR